MWHIAVAIFRAWTCCRSRTPQINIHSTTTVQRTIYWSLWCLWCSILNLRAFNFRNMHAKICQARSTYVLCIFAFVTKTIVQLAPTCGLYDKTGIENICSLLLHLSWAVVVVSFLFISLHFLVLCYYIGRRRMNTGESSYWLCFTGRVRAVCVFLYCPLIM